jgi:hypothetical protein
MDSSSIVLAEEIASEGQRLIIDICYQYVMLRHLRRQSVSGGLHGYTDQKGKYNQNENAGDDFTDMRERKRIEGGYQRG